MTPMSPDMELLFSILIVEYFKYFLVLNQYLSVQILVCMLSQFLRELILEVQKHIGSVKHVQSISCFS